jgi:hypothetical protein
VRRSNSDHLGNFIRVSEKNKNINEVGYGKRATCQPIVSLPNERTFKNSLQPRCVKGSSHTLQGPRAVSCNTLSKFNLGLAYTFNIVIQD